MTCLGFQPVFVFFNPFLVMWPEGTSKANICYLELPLTVPPLQETLSIIPRYSIDVVLAYMKPSQTAQFGR